MTVMLFCAIVMGQDRLELTSSHLTNLKFRCIGPAVTGGRIHDVEVLPDDPSTIYVGSASGGIWKSSNKGTTWKPVFDDQPVSTFGDIAIAPSSRDIIYAGTGEQQNRQSTSWGNGVYRSDDGGESWRHLGLEETYHTARIRVHPRNPDIVYVASPGNLWKGSDERGVFKSTDGGKSWEKVLYVNEYTGAIDLVMDPVDSNTLYAAMYQRLRRTWGFNGGGPGSGIYKTTDGGKTWRALTSGIPEGDKGRIGLAISRTNGKVLYATVEHPEEAGVYRSADGGSSWNKVNDLNPRPMYYSHIFIDPTDEDRVYLLAVEFYRSDDGGKTFRQMPTRPTYDVGVHSDHHTLWIDPANPEHFYLAGDAGLHESWDMGETYIRMNNFPIGQFYAIGYDMRTPYNVYGGMQDNHSWMGPSTSRHWIGIIDDDWHQIGFGDGMYQQPDPSDQRYVYSNAQNGSITRLDSQTGDLLDIRPYPPGDEEPYRFDWVTPILLSQHYPSTVYFGGNRLFISKDRGESWERTEDLTRQVERDSLMLMGVKGAGEILSKNDGTSFYGEITTIAESPLDYRILWVGTDDGNVQVSKNGGRSWTNVSGNVRGVRDGTYVSRIIASSTGLGVAYVALDAHRDGDFAPYLLKTTNFGKTWRKLTRGLPRDGSVNVIVEHPANPDLLFLGTEHALFVSTTGGERWTKFDSNLPTTLYDDLKIHPRDNDLIVGTHGRSIWILDDIAPLSEWSKVAAGSNSHLFSVRPATIFHYWKDTSYRGQGAWMGENLPFGALIDYYVYEAVDSLSLAVYNRAGKLIRRIAGSEEAGVIHRAVWDLRHEPPPYEEDDEEKEGLVKSETILPELPRSVDPPGPFVRPGEYTVVLSADGNESSTTVRVVSDPEMNIRPSQWRKRESFLLGLLELQRSAWDLSQRADDWSEKLTVEHDSLAASGEVEEIFAAVVDSVEATAKEINKVRRKIYRLAGEFNGSGVRQGSLYPPTETHEQRKARLMTDLQQEAEKFSSLRQIKQ